MLKKLKPILFVTLTIAAVGLLAYVQAWADKPLVSGGAEI